MNHHSAPGRSLPCQADRQKILEQVHLVLAEARLVAEQSDRTLALLAAERPGGTRTAAALVLTLPGTLDAFLGDK